MLNLEKNSYTELKKGVKYSQPAEQCDYFENNKWWLWTLAQKYM
jgi:hypothetical protein